MGGGSLIGLSSTLPHHTPMAFLIPGPISLTPLLKYLPVAT